MKNDIKFLRDQRIPMSDGVTLSASLRLPPGDGPFPCIIDMIPYRWRDGIAQRDKAVFEPLAALGFACLRLDVRGSGESGGIMDDEYTERQVQDSLDAIEWMSKQPWSNGNVGMMGNSWGGFSALGAVKKGHPALKGAIVSCASDDGHTDDAHFESGVALMENWLWGIHFTTLAAMPSDPELAAARGEDWMAEWKNRLEAVKPFPSHWMQQRANLNYMEQRNYRALDGRAPVLLVGGWLDQYARGQWRLAHSLTEDSRIVLGGQAHAYPHCTRKDLSMDFTPMVANWFGKHLKGEGAEIQDAAWVFTRKIPTADDPRASGWWIGLADRRKEQTVTLPAPEFVSAPSEKSGFIQSFGKICPGGDGGNEYVGYPSDPAPDMPRSWVYKFNSAELSEIYIGVPKIAVNHPEAFKGGVYLLRLFVRRKEFGLRRIGYAVVDGRASVPQAVEFTPYGWQADPGDQLELHVMPQAWPLLWAPLPSGDLPRDLFGALTLQQPESWREANIKPAPDAPAVDETPTAQATVVEEKDGWRLMRVDSPYSETVTDEGIRFGSAMSQAYEYGPTGEMKAHINCRYTLDWPERAEGVEVTTNIRLAAQGVDIKSVTVITATQGKTEVFRKEFSETLADALLPPVYR